MPNPNRVFLNELGVNTSLQKAIKEYAAMVAECHRAKRISANP